MWPAQRPVVGVEAGRRPVGRPAIAQPAGPPVLFRRQFGTCSLGATGRASAPRGLRQGKANVRKDTERSVAAERSRHSRRSLPTLLHCRPCSRQPGAAASAGRQHGAEARASPSAADETSGGSWSRRLVLPDQSAQFPQEQHRLTAPWRLLLAGRCGTEAGVWLGRRRLLSGKAWQAGASREVNVPVEEKVPLVVLLVRVAPLSSWLTSILGQGNVLRFIGVGSVGGVRGR